MRLLKVAVACVNQTPFAWDENFAHLRMAIAQARAEGVSLLCLPELSLTGYGCEDAWVANRPGTDLALRGVDILCNPSASHFAFGKFGVRQRFVIEGSRAFGVAYLYANLLGNEAGRVIYDGGGLIASGGELLARGRRFSFHDVELTTAG